ncbi:MAG: hypothetical protein MZU97_03795 [Bacillus subtilis]|nr:hypothetical protein [Bacillus subtilis]
MMPSPKASSAKPSPQFRRLRRYVHGRIPNIGRPPPTHGTASHQPRCRLPSTSIPMSTENRNDQFVESDTLYSQSDHLNHERKSGVVNLANQLGISEAKLAIIIQILIRENQTGNMARLIQLATTDINQLALVRIYLTVKEIHETESLLLI